MDKIEKIRQEIERRIEMYRNTEHHIDPNRIDEDECLLSFLDTLESEKPIEGLEVASVELADMLLAKPKDYVISAKADYWNGAHDGVIAGAKWQEENDQETIKLAEDHAFLAGADWQKEHTPLPEDSVLFNKGVEEGKRLMMEEAVDATVMASKCGDKYQQLLITDWNSSDGLHNGDKVRIVIVKEDEK